MYRQMADFLTGEIFTTHIRRVEDNAVIPFDPANTDYQEYLAWLDEGNEPLPPDQS